ncbi:MAG TPA: BON domain-containing protein [Candidatus Elarobacter sp.]|jgi:osmotically-inducible protein OsmY|nr:BON domain-containing protein [Candidatus Elarobacter sp.]
MKRVLMLLAALALGACTSQQKVPEPFGTLPPSSVFKDALILSAVKATLTADDPDSTTTLGVAVHSGVVTLRGTVRDAATRTKLVQSARNVTGVKSVVDDLTLNPHQPRINQQVGDVALEARIEAAITAQVGLQHVTVTVAHGVATLAGNVADAKTQATIVATTRGTSGVRNVVDHIRVGGT